VERSNGAGDTDFCERTAMTHVLARPLHPLDPAEHAPSCNRPGWQLDTSPGRFGMVVARCTLCGAMEWRTR
jgi:hypothetical protein